MKEFDAFNILNISENSSVEEIKKTFRKLIFLHHPDTSDIQDDKYAGLLIEAYKKAIDISIQRTKKEEFDLKAKFRSFYSFDIPEKIDLLWTYNMILDILKNIEKLFYEKNNLPFYANLISFLTRNCKENEIPEITGSFLSVLLVLINARMCSFDEGLKHEYEFEGLRKNFIRYVKDILETKNYMDYRFLMNAKKESLINDIVSGLRRTDSTAIKEELYSLMLIVMIFQEEDFHDNLFDCIKKEP